MNPPSTTAVEIGLARCMCGHGRSEHVYCNEHYPALCVAEVAPENEHDWPVCSCLDFEPDDVAELGEAG